ncbi:BTAD domain-containing putative transcriptional regulator [Krasilnikovia sp. M28-CT-15]|uniref:AfsR/SARP family transcriptional regulator n=1 Tax=Krasilnikovia sp. M28-CT-15 TaxID=3373540 RepID=UPI00387682FB
MDSQGPVTASIRVLGPLEVRVRDAPVQITAGKLRNLLASLLVRPNQVASVDQLVQWIWDGADVANPRGALHTYVRRLRDALQIPDILETAPGGYLLRVEHVQLDLVEFRRLAAAADRTDNVPERARTLRSALGWWRGPALADIPSETLRRDLADSLAAERLQVLEKCFDAELSLGRHDDLVREIREAAIDNPLHERVWAQLMLALYRCGRQAEALDVYQQIRGLLIERLGTEPAEPLRDLHQRILVADPRLVEPVTADPGPVAVQVPSQLPAATVGFVGRDRERHEALTVLARDGERTGVPIVVLSGPPGVGKTSLAVQVAHQVRHAYPDGQLYVNLRGFDLGPPQLPTSVLAQFLRALGLHRTAIPLSLDEQINLYRSQLADKRTLVVLDNAADLDHITPLLPGAPGCAVLITSRRRLGGLVVTNGARVLQVGMLEPGESRRLFIGMLAAADVAVSPAVADELAELCAHLPLAISIALANLVMVPGSDPAQYLADLREGNRLAAFTPDDGAESAVSATFALSYEALEPAERRAFRLLSLVPGPDFTADALAALADLTVAQARRLLDRIATANLLHQHAPGRFQFHDLLRRYARERLDEQDVAAPALERLGWWYLSMVDGAADQLHREFVRLPFPPSGPTGLPRPSDRHQAMAWLFAERPNLVAAISHFAHTELRHFAWLLADGLRGFFWTGNYRTDWLESTQTALAAAIEQGDEDGTAAMLRSLANLHNTLGDYAQAIDHHHRALAIHRRQGRQEESAATLNNIGLAYLSTGRIDELEAVCREALAIEEHLESPRCGSTTLGLLGAVHWSRGEIGAAIDMFGRSLHVARDLGIHHIESYGLRSLGLAHQALGEPDQARRYLDEALEVAARIKSLYDRSIALYGLALTHRDEGDVATARDYAERALLAFEECGDRTYEAETICVLAMLDGDEGDWTRSVQRAEQALAAGQKVAHADGIATSHAWLSVANHHTGRSGPAARHAETARQMLLDGVNRVTETRVWLLLAESARLAGDERATATFAHRAHALARQTGQRRLAEQAERLTAATVLTD